jgi:pimeloyl-ACP methyl ester carboxylesterase
LAAAAADVAAVIEQLDADRVIVAGWSMGGSLAQLLWRDHRDVLDGLVLCASTRSFMGTARERVRHESIRVAAVLARATSDQVACRVAMRIVKHMYGDEGLQHWINQQMERHSWRHVLELGVDLGRFRAHDWIGAVDVPTSVLVTMRDTWVPPARQFALAEATRAAIVRVDGDHAVCLNDPGRFVPAFTEACELVAAAIGRPDDEEVA